MSDAVQPAGATGGAPGRAAGMPGRPRRAGRVGGWTPARLAMLQAEYRTTPTVAALVARLNCLPGRPVSISGVWNTAAELGLRRGRPAVAPRVKPPPPAAPPPPVFDPVATDAATIAAWALENGFRDRATVALADVNARRLELRLPPFVLLKTRRTG